jgi:hypothetical protein
MNTSGHAIANKWAATYRLLVPRVLACPQSERINEDDAGGNRMKNISVYRISQFATVCNPNF